MKVACSALAYFSASIVSLLLMITWSFSSVSAPPKAHITHWHQALPSPTALPRAKPGRMAVGLELAAQVEELVDIGRDRRRSRPRRPRTCGRPRGRRRRRSAWRSTGRPASRTARRSATSRHTSRRDRWRGRRAAGSCPRTCAARRTRRGRCRGRRRRWPPTAIFGRRSSQLSKSTLTSTPVASVNFFAFARYIVSSPCDELGRAQHAQARRPARSRTSAAATSLTGISARRPPLASIVVPASAPAPSCNASRRVNKVMPCSLSLGPLRGRI